MLYQITDQNLCDVINQELPSKAVVSEAYDWCLKILLEILEEKKREKENKTTAGITKSWCFPGTLASQKKLEKVGPTSRL